MLCIKVPLNDRRSGGRSTTKIGCDSDKTQTYHRCCLAKEGAPSPEDHLESADNEDLSKISSRSSSSSSSSVKSGRRSERTESFPQPTKTSLTVTTLDMPDEVCAKAVASSESTATRKKKRSIKVPHNYQQYQQTILNKSMDFSWRQELKNSQLPDIFIRGMEIKDPNSSKLLSDADSVDDKTETNCFLPKHLEKYQMNEKGDTNINFDDFHRTFSFDEDCDAEEDLMISTWQMEFLNQEPSSNSGSRELNSPQKQSRVIKLPSPKTKQIIRVNVIKVANS